MLFRSGYAMLNPSRVAILYYQPSCHVEFSCFAMLKFFYIVIREKQLNSMKHLGGLGSMDIVAPRGRPADVHLWNATQD